MATKIKKLTSLALPHYTSALKRYIRQEAMMKIYSFRWQFMLLPVILLASMLLFPACSGDTDGSNQAPVISNLDGPDKVSSGGQTTITCEASDPDGDSLGYDWSATGGALSGSGPSVSWQAPDSNGTFQISVTVSDGRDSASQSLSITVGNGGPSGPNATPEILSLSATPSSIEPQRMTTITCEATDADGDPLSYRWYAPLGIISGSGSAINWQAPLEMGEYKVEVTVRDSAGNFAIKEITIKVAPNKLPRITKLEAEPEIIMIENSTTLVCTASDADDDIITYEWTAPMGTFTGSGDTVTWTAPSRAGYTEVTVTVKDGVGGTDSKSITVQATGLKQEATLTVKKTESGAVKSDGNVLFPVDCRG